MNLSNPLNFGDFLPFFDTEDLGMSGDDEGEKYVNPVVDYAVKTDRGSVRANNEDSVAVNFAPGGTPSVFIVADGLGGHSHGEIASSIAAEYCREYIVKEINNDDKLFDIQKKLVDIVSKANKQVYTESIKYRENNGMGTTLTLLLVLHNRAYLVHIGDSRCYMMREGVMARISIDHTLVQRLIDENELQEYEVEKHPAKHVLTQAVGMYEGVHPDITEIHFEKGDKFLLCSDGLHGFIDEELIEKTMFMSLNATEAADTLVQLALDAGGLDNVSVITVFT